MTVWHHVSMRPSGSSGGRSGGAVPVDVCRGAQADQSQCAHPVPHLLCPLFDALLASCFTLTYLTLTGTALLCTPHLWHSTLVCTPCSYVSVLCAPSTPVCSGTLCSSASVLTGLCTICSVHTTPLFTPIVCVLYHSSVFQTPVHPTLLCTPHKCVPCASCACVCPVLTGHIRVSRC